MEAEVQKELQLLPAPQTAAAASSSQASSRQLTSDSSRKLRSADPFEGPSLDLQLSISVRPIRQTKDYNTADVRSDPAGCVKALRGQAAEQIRLAAIEKDYAERVLELSRREMEMAQTEFARARSMWERAREEVEKAEKMKARATRHIDSTCMEITCHSCRQKFRP